MCSTKRKLVYDLGRFTPFLGFSSFFRLKSMYKHICMHPKCCFSLTVGLFTRTAIVSSWERTVCITIASPVIFFKILRDYVLCYIYPEFWNFFVKNIPIVRCLGCSLPGKELSLKVADRSLIWAQRSINPLYSLCTSKLPYFALIPSMAARWHYNLH